MYFHTAQLQLFFLSYSLNINSTISCTILPLYWCRVVCNYVYFSSLPYFLFLLYFCLYFLFASLLLASHLILPQIFLLLWFLWLLLHFTFNLRFPTQRWQIKRARLQFSRSNKRIDENKKSCINALVSNSPKLFS